MPPFSSVPPDGLGGFQSAIDDHGPGVKILLGKGSTLGNLPNSPIACEQLREQ